MRSLTTAAQSAVAGPTTRPLYFVEISLSPVMRYCTYDAVSWAGNVWSGDVPIEVNISGVDGSGRQSASIEIGNETGAIGAILLGQIVSDKRVRIWSADASALSDTDPVLVFDGVISSSEVSAESARISLVSQGSRTIMVPRRYIDKAGGFSVLLPAGTKIQVGGETVILERRK